jgi:hypothetical protein
MSLCLGTFETCRPALTMSASTGEAEAMGGLPE